MLREGLPERAQAALAACDTLRGLAAGDDRRACLEALLRYRHCMRLLSRECSAQDEQEHELGSVLNEERLSLWSANQKYNDTMSEIELLKKQPFKFLAVDIKVVQRLRTGDITVQQRDYILAELERERAERERLQKALEKRKDDLEAVKRRLEAQKADRRRLEGLLSALMSSPAAINLQEELKKYSATAHSPASPQLKPKLKDIFEELCNTPSEDVFWKQLRFFPAAAPCASGSSDEREKHGAEDIEYSSDALYNSAFSTQDQLRIALNGAIVVTCFVNSATNNSNVQLKMDAIEFRMSEEETDTWLKSIASSPHSSVSTSADLVNALKRIRTIWKMEEELVEECTTASDTIFSDISRLKPHPHTFTFRVQSTSSSAAVTVCTCPQMSWKLESPAAAEPDDEVFSTRCRLVQDRLNTPEMLASPLTLQLAFLRKLVQ